MFDWLKGSRDRSTTTRSPLAKELDALFEQLETRSYNGPVDDEATLTLVTQTIDLAERILQACAHLPPLTSFPEPLTRVYLGGTLDKRARYYLRRAFGGLLMGGDYAFTHDVIRQQLDSRPGASECINMALPDLNRLLCEEMREDVALRSYYLVCRCTCWRALEQYRLAVEDAQRLVELEPHGPNSYVLLSQCYSDYGDYPYAIEAATKAIESAMDDIERYRAWSNRASINKVAGNTAAFERDLQRVQQLEPKAQRAWDAGRGLPGL